MSETGIHEEGRGLGSILGRRKIKITGNHEGDIHTDKPVVIAPGATAVGHICAPQVNVSGLLYGTVAARHVKVDAQGQIWGDVQTNRLEMEPGGKIQGWVSDIDEAEYASLFADEPIPEPQEALDPSAMPAGLAEAIVPPRGEEETETMRRLRAEAGEVLLARVELESAFEERVAEAAGERAARAESLEEQLDATQSELEKARQEIAALKEELGCMREQLEGQGEALAEARQDVQADIREMDELRGAIVERDQELERQKTLKREAETRLQDGRQQTEQLKSRVASLEAALQASLQTESEQEQSLLRWQELAEVSQERVDALERELASLRETDADSAESASLRTQLQESDDRSFEFLAELQAKDLEIAALQEQQALLRQSWIEANAELDALRGGQPADHERASRPGGSEDALAGLEVEAAGPSKMVESLRQQLLWQKAEHESLQAELEQAKKQVSGDQQRIRGLEAELSASQALLMERELRLQETDKATEERIAKLESKLQEQARLLRRMKEVAGERIQELEARLARRT